MRPVSMPRPAVPAAFEQFAMQLRRRRRAAGLTQDALAEQAGLSVRAISDLERGVKAPQRATVDLLARALALSPAEGQAFSWAAERGRLRREGGDGGTAPLPTKRPCHNLPAPLTSFVGQERELAKVKVTLEQARLVTLTGTGGSGKSRLALRAGADLLDRYPDGVWLVELAPLADPALVAVAVAAVLEVREQQGQPLAATLVAVLHPRRLLLLLDNCEHVLDACAQLAEALLRGCPTLNILATSREALGIAGECTRRVPPLATPDPEQLPQHSALLAFDAVRLFVGRACAAQAGFALTEGNAAAVAQVCARLDGMPLAIELAAAWIRVLPVQELLARLDDRFRLLTGGDRTALPRQRTLQATVAWSYDLLTDQERRLFDRLSVFAGGFTLEAAGAVCAGDGIEDSDVLHFLARLVDQSLVIADVASEDGGGRFRLLETLRQYGREHLAAGSGSVAVQRRHAAYFLDLAEQAGLDAARIATLDRLGADLNNMRTALRWRLDQGATDDGLRLAAALGPLWAHLGHPGEGYAWLKALLDLPNGVIDARTRAKGLCWAGALAHMVGDAAEADARLGDSIAYGRAAQDDVIVGEAALRLGLLSIARGDYATARRLVAESLAARRRTGTREQVLRSIHFLVLTMVYQGEHVAAQALLDGEAIEGTLAVGYRYGAAARHGLLGLMALACGDRAAARRNWDESLRLFQDSMDWSEVSAVQNYLASLDVREGRVADARAGFAASLALTRPARFVFRAAASLDGLAVLAVREGRMERALRLAGASAALRASAGYQAPPPEQAELEPALAAARDALGEAAAAAWAAGKALGLDQAVDEALEESPDA